MFRALLAVRLASAAFAVSAVLLASAACADDPRPVVKLPPLTESQYADEKVAAKTADELEKQFAGKKQPEAVKMLVSILRGSQMGPRDGWFGPAQSRFSWAWLAERHKLDATAKELPKSKFQGDIDLFARLDRDGDGSITPGDLDWSDANPYVQRMGMVTGFHRMMDGDRDSKLTRDELDAFFKRVSKGKDHISPDDLRAAMLPPPSKGFAPGDGPSIPVLVKGLYGSEIGSIQEGPAVGDQAPDFTLKTIDGKQSVHLSKLTGPKPVVLVFGNFSCGPFRTIFPEADALRERYKDRAHFVMVYVREAHPTDGWVMASNGKMGVAVKQPTTTEERTQVCEQFVAKAKPGMTVVVDDIKDTAGNAYSGMPARFYVIDPKGKVAFKSGRGPFGFKPGEMEQALVMTLLEAAPAKDTKTSWNLPAPQTPPLPAWAVALSKSLPRTTARMLELDYLHRANNPLGTVMAARVRFAVAEELDGMYGKLNAEADLLRTNGLVIPTELETAATLFARKLTKEGHAITDAEFAATLKAFGPEKTTALVHTVAYANFHNRVVLGLNVAPRVDPPVQVAFDAEAVTSFPSPKRPAWDEVAAAKHDGLQLRPAWSKADHVALGSSLESQKSRTSRIPLPPPAHFDTLSGREKEQALKIVWNTVSTGYQPGMTRAWFACLNEFYAESQVNRVFTNSMFWVVTRTNDCFY